MSCCSSRHRPDSALCGWATSLRHPDDKRDGIGCRARRVRLRALPPARVQPAASRPAVPARHSNNRTSRHAVNTTTSPNSRPTRPCLHAREQATHTSPKQTCGTPRQTANRQQPQGSRLQRSQRQQLASIFVPTAHRAARRAAAELQRATQHRSVALPQETASRNCPDRTRPKTKRKGTTHHAERK